jgi:hypothetical protein
MTRNQPVRQPPRQANPTERVGCHGETTAVAQRQFQFRNLSRDSRLILRLDGILTPPRATG